ncbi:polysaccharide deacetylase family protein (PEP-CTERM system associated) [Bradyrhizobium sp. AZCC 1719]|uniref:polysaccharide deacetylase family protein n=1 Tax=Bradyrhizobium sp. AZCC 1719 TaxID=3117028 RepID=UPI002FF2F26A
MSPPVHILTFDIEDWFHVLEHRDTASESDWCRFESRVERNTDRILECLDEANIRATFFCLGWIARTHPQVVKAISAAGHEIGSHSDRHLLVNQMTQRQFRDDLRTSIASLEDLTGHRVRAFRSPGFSISHQSIWAFSVLAENGVEWDSSVFASPHSHSREPALDITGPVTLEWRGVRLKQFPVVPGCVLGRRISFSGGGYFRLLPYGLIRHLMSKSNYAMTYFHPRDFDPDQPLIPNLPLHRAFRSYVGLKSALAKFKALLGHFHFIDISEANKLLDWDALPKLELDSTSLSIPNGRKICLPA